MMFGHGQLLTLLGLTTLTLALTIGGGYVVLRAVSWLDEVESLALGGAVGVALAGGIAWSAFLLGQFEIEYYVGVTMFILIISLGLVWYRERSLLPHVDFSQWPVYLAWWLILLGTQSLLPIYAGGGWYGDWWMHFEISQFYLGQRALDVTYFGQYTVFSRTPLFNLVEAFFMALWGRDFAVYQLTALIPNVVFVPLFLLLIKSRRVAVMLVLLALNPFIWLNLLYPWPKLLAAAYILASLYLYLRPGSSAWAWGGFMGLAVLSHPSAIFYGLGLALDLSWSKRSNFKMITTDLVWATVGLVGVIMPWFIWGRWLTGSWFFLAGSVVSGRKPFNLLWWLVERVLNFGVTFVPYDLLGAMYRAVTQLALPSFELSSLDPIFHYYYNTLPGALTTVLSLYLMKQGWPSWFKALAGMGLLGGVLLQPGLAKHGVAPESMAPLVLLGLVLVGRGLDIIRNYNGVLGVLALEFIASRGLHLVALVGYFIEPSEINLQLKHDQALHFVRDGLGGEWLGLLMVMIGVSYGVLLWVVWRKEKD
jgi:hypothetical protein